MALTIFSPFHGVVGLRAAMDRLFDERMVRPNGAFAHTGTAYDLYETEEGLTFRFAVPGVRPEDVEVTVDRSTLSVKAAYPQPGDEQKGQTWHVRGLPQSGEFRYSFRLQTAVDADRAAATFEHGILTLSLPKAESAKPKRIQISAPSLN
jgi:HSP20 family protein